MRRATESVFVLLLTWACAVGCGGTQSGPEAPAQPGSPEPAAQPPPSATDGAAPRASLTAEACEASGGSVVGDIGDGAIHRPDYRCPSGAAPSGAIRAAEGAPMAVEGSVCCPR